MNKQFNPSQKVREAKITGSTNFIGIHLWPPERLAGASRPVSGTME
jgi:hypothetical protein